MGGKTTTAPLEGKQAPRVQLPDQDGRIFDLGQLRGQKVVLYFYPKAHTSGCTREAQGFAELYPEFKRRKVAVIGVSPDPPSTLKKFQEKLNLPFPLLSDQDHKVAEAFGVWKEKKMYGQTRMGIERSTFIIDENGKVVKAFLKVKPDGHAREVLKALEQLDSGS